MVDSEETSTPKPVPDAVRSPLRVESPGCPIALFDTGGAVYAIEDGCLRCGSTLVTGMLDESAVTCRSCGWRYDLGSGSLVGVPALRLATFRVRASGTAATEAGSGAGDGRV